MVSKNLVKRHWEEETAGVRYGEGADDTGFYRSVERRRYDLEPYIPAFARFDSYTDRSILEIGVGGGVDFSQFVLHGANAVGVDLTSAGLGHTGRLLRALRPQPKRYELSMADAENLGFRDASFDLVYSWGVLHHTPNTEQAFSEALRVLRPGGELKAMIYHTRSWTCWMLWLRHSLMRARPWVSPKQCVYQYLESPGTKVYTGSEAKQLLKNVGFTDVRAETRLGPGDLLDIMPSQRYQGRLYKAIWKLYPRWLVSLLGDRFGLYLLLTAKRSEVPEADVSLKPSEGN